MSNVLYWRLVPPKGIHLATALRYDPSEAMWCIIAEYPTIGASMTRVVACCTSAEACTAAMRLLMVNV